MDGQSPEYFRGTCVVARTPAGLRIDRADPRVLVSAELLAMARAGGLHPDVRLDGDLLYIAGTNRLVIYRLGESAPPGDCYYAAWPD